MNDEKRASVRKPTTPYGIRHAIRDIAAVLERLNLQVHPQEADGPSEELLNRLARFNGNIPPSPQGGSPTTPQGELPGVE